MRVSRGGLASSRRINLQVQLKRRRCSLHAQRWYASPSKFKARLRLIERGLTLPSSGPAYGRPLKSNVSWPSVACCLAVPRCLGLYMSAALRARRRLRSSLSRQNSFAFHCRLRSPNPISLARTDQGPHIGVEVSRHIELPPAILEPYSAWHRSKHLPSRLT